MTRYSLQKAFFIFASAIFLLAFLHAPAWAASDEDMQTLGMYYEPNDLVVSATRNPTLLSQTAENITVVTASEIEMMGAHTLADVLSNVSGIATDDRGSIGTFTGVRVLGAHPTHVLVLLDGVRFNNYFEEQQNIEIIPVQNIERIEIIKGPGSSSWGSALGGVINVVTKSPDEEKRLGGALSASLGEKMTRDLRGELSGTIDRFGYYLYAGHLASDGLSRHSGVESNNLYGKLRWEFPRGGNLLLTVNYNRDSQMGGQSESLGVNIDGKLNFFLATLSLNLPLNDHIDIDLAFHTSARRGRNVAHNLADGSLFDDGIAHEDVYGGSVKLTWRGGINSLAAGVDYDHIDFKNDDEIWAVRTLLHSDKVGIFLNDTLAFRDVAISAGIRYDQMNPVGDFFSPSLGVAWNPTDKITFRVYGARGYSLPLINTVQQKVWTVQTGVETTYIPWLWLRTTFFRNQISNIDNFDGTFAKVLKQGVEVEGKSVPFFNTSLSAGYAFVDATDSDTGKTIPDIARQIVKLGLHYDDERHSFRGALLGRYALLQATSGENARYSAIIWDLNLSKKLFNLNDTAVDLFFNAHNLFNGSQYGSDEMKNARRWFEGGIRFKF